VKDLDTLGLDEQVDDEALPVYHCRFRQ